MTTDKARKRAVRTRMQKTGERYAAARRHVTTIADTAPAAAPPEAVEPDQPTSADLPQRVGDPGMAEEGIRKGTGQGWDDWLRELDAWGATSRTHTEIARHVGSSYDITGWWAQTVTVGYERARGMRAKHETTRGFEVSVSKTVAAPPEVVWPAIAEPDGRSAWMGPETLTVRERGSKAGVRIRFDIPGDGTRVGIFLTPKGETRTVVTVTHERLAGPEAVAERRASWRERLGRLAASV
jgi:hypothetical protein